VPDKSRRSFDSLHEHRHAVERGDPDAVSFRDRLAGRRNGGGEDLRVLQVEPSCGCTTALLSAPVLRAGDRGTLRVVFDSADFAGEVVKDYELRGQAGIGGHITIGDDVGVGAKSGVVQDIPSRSVFAGFPAIPHAQWLRAQNIYSKLPLLKKELGEMEKRLLEIEKSLKADKEQGDI